MSQLITEIVKCKTNDWGIWDPSPNSLEWCADGPISTAASLVAISNKNYVEQNPPVFITESDTDLGKCNRWEKKPSMPHTYPIEELSNTVPLFSSGETKFRFIIIPAGPPGSGKSIMNKNIKKKAKQINFRAFNKRWNKIGHDDIICKDPIFVQELNIISDSIPKNEYNHTDVYKDINANGEWYKLMIAQNELYNFAKSWSKTTMTKLQKREFAKNVALFIYELINTDVNVPPNVRAQLLEILVNVGKTTKPNIYLELNNFLFNLKEITNNNDVFNIISQQVSPDAIPPIHNLYDDPCFDNDILLYLITTLSVLFGMNFTYETTLNKTDSLQFLFETCTFLTNKCNNYNYIFLLGFPIVNFENLVKRIIERYLTWHNNRNICSVGLPLFDLKNYFIKMSTAYLNITSYIYYCKSNELCNGVGLDYIFLFDNNGEIPDDSYDMIRISQRALIITPETAKDKRMANSYKKTIIAILMRALGCFKNSIVYFQSEGKITNCGDNECKDDDCDDNIFLPSSQEIQYSSQDTEYDESTDPVDYTPENIVETIKEHQQKLRRALRESEVENIDDILEACIARMKDILPYLSTKEIKKQCLVSQNRVVEFSNIKKSPGDADILSAISEGNTRNTSASGTTKKKQHRNTKKKQHRNKKRKTKRVMP